MATSSKTPNNDKEGDNDISHSINAHLTQNRSEVQGFPVEANNSKSLVKTSYRGNGEKGANQTADVSQAVPVQKNLASASAPNLNQSNSTVNVKSMNIVSILCCDQDMEEI